MTLRFLAVALGAAAFFVPATAGAVAIHVHDKVPVTHERIVGKSPDGLVTERWTSMREVVRVKHVAPADPDDNGVPGTQPVPEPEPETATVAAPAEPSYSAAPSSSGYSIPSSIVECESGGDYGAVNPSSGAYGAYQILPSTSASYGCDMSSAAGQDACAAEIYSDVGGSAWVC